MPAYSPTSQPTPASYPNLRGLLAPEYASLPDEHIETLMEGTLGESAEDYEKYLEGIFDGIGSALSSVARDVGKFAAKAAPVVATVGGGALQGALAGAPLGLPGILAGAAAGGAGAALSKYGKGTARDIGGALSGVTGLAGQFSPAGRLGSAVAPVISGLAGGDRRGAGGAAVNALGSLLGGGAGGAGGALGGLAGLFGGSSAIGQLASVLQRPEARQALEALKLRTASPAQPIGRSTIPVGSAQTPVPVAAIANLIGALANQAVAEAAALSDGAEGQLRYMLDQAGEFVGDPALEQDRAARVWDLLNEAQAERLLRSVAMHEQAVASDEGEFDEDASASEADYYDAIDLAETYAVPTEDLGELLLEYDAEDYGEWEESERYAYA